MSTNIAKLKHRKGTPPSASNAADATSDNARAGKPALRPSRFAFRPMYSRISASVRAGSSVSPWRKEATVSQDVGSVQGAKHVSIHSCMHGRVENMLKPDGREAVYENGWAAGHGLTNQIIRWLRSSST